MKSLKFDRKNKNFEMNLENFILLNLLVGKVKDLLEKYSKMFGLISEIFKTFFYFLFQKFKILDSDIFTVSKVKNMQLETKKCTCVF